MYFTVEEENLICLYHNADRRRTAIPLHRRISKTPGAEVSKPLRPALLFCNKAQIKTSLPFHF